MVHGLLKLVLHLLWQAFQIAYHTEADIILHEDFIFEREDALLADLAQAARALVAADKEYEATVKAAFAKLDVKVEA